MISLQTLVMVLASTPPRALRSHCHLWQIFSAPPQSPAASPLPLHVGHLSRNRASARSSSGSRVGPVRPGPAPTSAFWAAVPYRDPAALEGVVGGHAQDDGPAIFPLGAAPRRFEAHDIYNYMYLTIYVYIVTMRRPLTLRSSRWGRRGFEPARRIGGGRPRAKQVGLQRGAAAGSSPGATSSLKKRCGLFVTEPLSCRATHGATVACLKQPPAPSWFRVSGAHLLQKTHTSLQGVHHHPRVEFLYETNR
jgi:hypothetical protein